MTETENKTTTLTTTLSQEDEDQIVILMEQIKDPLKREKALDDLCKKRDKYPDLALYLWYTPGVVIALLQEIISTYHYLAPPNLNEQTSSKAYNVLALFQCIAAHSLVRTYFISAQIPIFLYPFLNTVNKSRPFEYLRLTALGVIGALVKVDSSEVINFLLSTEIIPLCLRIMERGSEVSKTVATFIVQRILLDELGLNYVCNTAERFYAISTVLNNIVNKSKSPVLIRHVIRSYSRLSESHRVKSILKENIPQILNDKAFQDSLDETSKKWLSNMYKNLGMTNLVNQQPKK